MRLTKPMRRTRTNVRVGVREQDMAKGVTTSKGMKIDGIDSLPADFRVF